jgi:hypothetical protein
VLGFEFRCGFAKRCVRRLRGRFEIRDANLALMSVTAKSELEGIAKRTEVPGIALHASGASIHVPFLTGPAPVSAPFAG